MIKLPGPIPEDALRYFRGKVNLPGFDYRDVWQEEHASSFTVAKAMQVDVLQGIRDALDQALADGLTFRQFAADLMPTLEGLGWWGIKEMVDPLTGKRVKAQLGSPRRLKTIYRANLRTARAAGQWNRAEKTKQALPYLLYENGPSREHRIEHVSWHGTLLSINDPWWNTHMPPNGWGCKCRVRQVSRVEADRLKRNGLPAPGRKQIKRVPVKTTAPEIHRVAWKNKRTGETEMVPEGIDPGWDTNPGKTRQKNLEKLIAGKLDGADPNIVKAAKADLAAYKKETK